MSTTTPRIAAVFGAVLVCLVAAGPAGATIRFAVPAGGPGDGNCLSTGANCSLKTVLENVVGTGDEVVVMPGTHDASSAGIYVKNGISGLNVHGQDGQPRPRVTATAAG